MDCPKCNFEIPENANQCPNCESLVKQDSQDSDIISNIIGMLLVLGAGFFLVKSIKWVAKNIDWDKMGKLLSDSLYQFSLSQEVTQIHPRLEQAETILETNENYCAEMSASLACGALESGLRYLHGPFQSDSYSEPRGLIDLADILYDQRKISIYDSEEIKKIARDIRNPTAHGKLIEDPFKVKNSISWIRDFTDRNISIAV